MNPKRKQRLYLTVFLFLIAGGVTTLLIQISGENMNMFYPPEDVVSGKAPVGERLRAEGASYVDIAPLQGRCVVFRSTLLHEVLPTKRRPRRAVTQWFYAPFVKK